MQGILKIGCNLLRCLVQEVLGRQLDFLVARTDAHFRDGVHVHIDEIIGRHGLFRLDVHGHLPEIQLVYPFKERKLEAGAADQDARCLPQA